MTGNKIPSQLRSPEWDSIFQALDLRAGAYKVFLRHGVPLLLFPDVKTFAEKALSLYLPQTWYAKIAKVFLSYSSVRVLLTKRVFLDGCGETSACILFCNSDHGLRVIAVQRNDAHGWVVWKLTDEAHRGELQAEYETLRSLQGSPGVPRVFKQLELKGIANGFEMEYLAPLKRIRGLEDAAIHTLLASFETGTTAHAEEIPLLADLLPDLSTASRARIKGAELPTAWIHGDFALWNLRQDASGNPVCIDLEKSHPKGPIGFDLLYALSQEEALVHKRPQDHLKDSVFRRIQKTKWMQELLGRTAIPFDVLFELVTLYRARNCGKT